MIKINLLEMSKIRFIKLTKQKYAIIDDEDYNKIKQYTWYTDNPKASYTCYACTSIHKKNIKMHRMIMRVTNVDIPIDHANGNGLDNRKKNLRICTKKDNARNSRPKKHKIKSKYKGVWKRASGKWCAVIGGKTRVYLGDFYTEKRAAIAYDDAAIEMYKEYSYLNFANITKKEKRIIIKNENTIKKRMMNKENISPYRGVFWNSRQKKWQTQIKTSKKIHLGFYNQCKDAALIYDRYILYGNINKKRNFPHTCLIQIDKKIIERKIKITNKTRERIGLS